MFCCVSCYSRGRARTCHSPALVQLGPEVCLPGLTVGKVSCAWCAVELTLPWEVVVYVEHRLLPLLLLYSQLVLDLVHVFSPKIGRRSVWGLGWDGLAWFRFGFVQCSVFSPVQFVFSSVLKSWIRLFGLFHFDWVSFRFS